MTLYQQPQVGPFTIDWSNPLTSGLLLCAPIGPMSNTPRNLVTGELALFMGSNSAAVTERGLARAFAFSAADRIDFRIPVINGDRTLFVLVKPNTSPNGDVPIGAHKSSGGSAVGQYLAAEGGGSKWATVATSGNNWAVSSGPSPSANVSASLAGRFFYGGRQDLFLNGALSGTSGTARSVDGVDIVTLAAYREGATAYSGYRGVLDLALCWNRALSDAELASLSSNPWQLFESDKEWDDLAAASALGGVIAENSTASDSCGAMLVSAVAVAEAVAAMEAQMSAAAAARGMVENSAAAELASSSAAMSAAAADIAAASNTVGSSASAIVAAVSESSTVTDLAGAQQQAAAILADSVDGADVAGTAAVKASAQAEAAGAAETTNPTGATIAAAVAEAGMAADAYGAGAQLIAAIAEAGVPSDVIWAALAAAAGASDSAPLVDSATATLVATVHLADVLAALESSGAAVPSGQVSAVMRYVVEAESRVYMIAPDDRRYVVVADARNYTVN